MKSIEKLDPQLEDVYEMLTSSGWDYFVKKIVTDYYLNCRKSLKQEHLEEREYVMYAARMAGIEFVLNKTYEMAKRPKPVWLEALFQ